MTKLNTLPVFLLLFIISFGLKAQPAKFVEVKGREIIGPDKKPFLMRGTNLGNWLVPEGYMFKFKSVNSPRLINEVLSEILGPDATQAFWRKFQDTYITAADIHFLKASGMNSIRIPFNYRLFTTESYL
ncbi:MAG: glycoside hydrolase family 5 protein, partial [Mucilaginibacter sp.]